MGDLAQQGVAQEDNSVTGAVMPVEPWPSDGRLVLRELAVTQSTQVYPRVPGGQHTWSHPGS